MATRTLAAKRPARKTTGAGARHKSVAKADAPLRKPRAKSSAAAAVADDASLRDLAARLGKLELAGLAGKLVQS